MKNLFVLFTFALAINGAFANSHKAKHPAVDCKDPKNAAEKACTEHGAMEKAAPAAPAGH